MTSTLARRVLAEGLGTAFLLAIVVGSGVMGERLSGGNVAIALLANTLATGAGLVALLLTFGPVSGAHLNPAVTVAVATQGGVRWRDVPWYLAAQTLGAFVGVAVAHVMFSESLFSASQHARSGTAQLVSEFVATFGLLATIFGVARSRAAAVPFAGIRPLDVPGFLVAQVLGATAATATFAWLLPVRRGAEPVPLRDELEKPEREVA